jgi:hypothetical protein
MGELSATIDLCSQGQQEASLAFRVSGFGPALDCIAWWCFVGVEFLTRATITPGFKKKIKPNA